MKPRISAIFQRLPNPPCDQRAISPPIWGLGKKAPEVFTRIGDYPEAYVFRSGTTLPAGWSSTNGWSGYSEQPRDDSDERRQSGSASIACGISFAS
jgi:hypothetical protein